MSDVWFHTLRRLVPAVATAAALAAPVGGATGIAGTHTAVVRISPSSPEQRVIVTPTPRSTWIPNNTVYALATDGTYVYLGGSFTTLTSPTTTAFQTHARLARVNLATGLPDPSWTPSVDGDVRALAVDPASSTLYLGGSFATVDGTARTDLAAVSTAGSGSLLGLNRVPNGDVRALLLDGSGLVVAGSFTKIDATTRNHVAKIATGDGSLDPAFHPVVDGGVLALTAPTGSGTYGIGGSFGNVGGVAHPFIALVDRTTGAVTSWSPATFCTAAGGCPVLGLASNGTRIFLGSGGPGGRVLSYDLATGTKQWDVAADGDVQTIALVRDELFAGGHFDPRFGGQRRQTLAALSARTGAVDPGFAPTATKTFPGTWTLLGTAAGLAVGGAQSAIGGTSLARFAIFPTGNPAPLNHGTLGTRAGGQVIRPRG